MRELRALGAARRAGRVDDRRDVREVGEAAPAHDLGVVHAGAVGRERGDRAGVDREHVPQPGAWSRTSSTVAACASVSTTSRRTSASEDPLHLLRARRLVERHGHRARRPRRPVEERPLVARARHDAHVVAGLDAAGDETLRDGDDLGVELARAERLPRTVGTRAALDHRRGRVGRDAAREEVVEVLRGIDFDDPWGADLVHSGSSGSSRRWENPTQWRRVPETCRCR